MIIQHNIMAINSHRQLGINNTNLGKNLEKLSSGYRINKAADDAAGLAISEKMRAQITGLNRAVLNAQDGASLIQTAEGALQEVHGMLNRMVELATQSANGTIQADDRQKIEAELTALKDEIDRISDATNFNGIKLLDGSLAGAGGGADAPVATLPAEFAEGETLATATEATLGKLTSVEQVLAGAKDGTIAAELDGTDFKVSFENADGETVTYVADVTQAITDLEDTTANTGASSIMIDFKLEGDTAVAMSVELTDTTTASDADVVFDDLKNLFEGVTVGAPAAAEAPAAADPAAAPTVDLGDFADLTTPLTLNDDVGEEITLTGVTGLEEALAAAGADATMEMSTDATTITITDSEGTATVYEATIGTEFDASGTPTLSYTDAVSGESIDLALDVTTAAGGDETSIVDAFNAAAGSVSVTAAAAGDPADPAAGTGLTMQVGDTADSFNKITVSVDDMSAEGLGIDGISMATQDASAAALDVVKAAIEKVSVNRGNLGALQNRLEHTINNLNVTSENMTAAESRIRDVDMAKEMMAFTKNNVLAQAAQAMLAQANQQPQQVLQLLR